MGETIVVILNPRAGAGRAARQLPTLLRTLEAGGAKVDLRETEEPGHAAVLAREALREGAPGVAVVGGDGTLSEALNGFLDADGTPVRPGAWIGPLPCGTGGDFRKTLGFPKAPEASARRLLAATPRPLDIGWLEYVGHEGESAARAFVNIASFGLGGLVDQLVNDAPKWIGGRLAFFVGTLRAMRRYDNRAVRLVIDDAPPVDLSVLNLAVANGRYFGGGMHVAPTAAVDDGLFDVVALEREGVAGNLGLTRHLYGNSLLGQAGVRHWRGRVVEATPLCEEPVLLDVDGEAPGRLPARFTLVANAVTLR
ncbi:MAG: diacylglycerol kinase family lipid kinase [Myxococcales bacterium]|nr:diacylglycerol kinase family lipid kinase [Myxococcales bacterium]